MASRNFVKSFGLHEGKSLTAFDHRFSHNVGLGLRLRLGRKWVWHRWTTLIVIKREVWGSPVQASLKKKKFICLGQVLVAIHEMSFAECRIFSCDMQGLVPWPGIEPGPGPPALGAQSLTHWTTKEVHQPRLPAETVGSKTKRAPESPLISLSLPFHV